VRLDQVTEPGPAQLGPQPGNQRVQGVARVARRFSRPDLPRERSRRHDTPGVQSEQSEQNAQLTSADVNGAPSPVPHLKRAK
jgi:hypothetical protein